MADNQSPITVHKSTAEKVREWNAAKAAARSKNTGSDKRLSPALAEHAKSEADRRNGEAGRDTIATRRQTVVVQAKQLGVTRQTSANPQTEVVIRTTTENEKITVASETRVGPVEPDTIDLQQPNSQRHAQKQVEQPRQSRATTTGDHFPTNEQHPRLSESKNLSQHNKPAHQTNEELAQTNEELAQTNEELAAAQKLAADQLRLQNNMAYGKTLTGKQVGTSRANLADTTEIKKQVDNLRDELRDSPEAEEVAGLLKTTEELDAITNHGVNDQTRRTNNTVRLTNDLAAEAGVIEATNGDAFEQMLAAGINPNDPPVAAALRITHRAEMELDKSAVYLLRSGRGLGSEHLDTPEHDCLFHAAECAREAAVKWEKERDPSLVSTTPAIGTIGRSAADDHTFGIA